MIVSSYALFSYLFSYYVLAVYDEMFPSFITHGYNVTRAFKSEYSPNEYV